MKIFNKILILFLVMGFAACTSDFEEINTSPSAISAGDASAAYFVTKPIYKLYAPSRYTYWRAHLIHADRYAGYFSFGNNGCWWNDGLGYTFHGGYTQATWEMYGDYFRYINTLLKITDVGGDFENELTYAVALVLKSSYYQQYSDVFGDVPYSEAGDAEILLPKFDAQKDIYQGIIADLNTAMASIGDNTITGIGVEDIGANDLLFGGDLQKWKAFANSLKLRIALRAYGAPGADFADGAINEALNTKLMEEGVGAIIVKDNGIDQFESSSYGDIWHRFGGLGSKWKVTQTMVNYLRDNFDPRLSLYAKPAQGGSVDFDKPTEDLVSFTKRVDYIKSILDEAGATYTFSETDTTVTIDLVENTFYIGQPTRLNGDIKGLTRNEFFSDPQDYIIAPDGDSDDVLPEIAMSTAEVYFLRAEAAVKGFTTVATAEELFQSGIRSAMELYNISTDDINLYLASSNLALLNGTDEENFEKISIQRWIASYTDGFEGWSIVRKTGYPSVLSAGVDDIDIFSHGDINGDYPTRMQYGPNAYDLNGASVNDAISNQGADKQNTVLWWAK